LISLDDGCEMSLRDLAVLMMMVSDNVATNMLIERLGIAAINRAIKDAGLTQTELRNKLDFKLVNQAKENFGISSPADYAEFYARLARQELLSADDTAQMLKIMRIQKYIEPLRRYLPFSPYAEEFGEMPKVTVASKGGSFSGSRCDAGVITTPKAVWSLALMSKDVKDTAWTSDNEASVLISNVSKAVYDAWA
jgi:beta-lactamase class A